MHPSTEKLPSLLLLLERITSCLSYQNSLMHLGCKTTTLFKMHFSFTAVCFRDGLYLNLCIVCKRIVLCKIDYKMKKKIWGPRQDLKKRAEKILRIVSLFCDLRGDLWWCRMPSIFISKKIESSGPRTRPSKYIKRTCNPHWLYVSVPRCYYCDFLESFLANEIST